MKRKVLTKRRKEGRKKRSKEEGKMKDHHKESKIYENNSNIANDLNQGFIHFNIQIKVLTQA